MLLGNGDKTTKNKSKFCFKELGGVGSYEGLLGLVELSDPLSDGASTAALPLSVADAQK